MKQYKKVDTIQVISKEKASDVIEYRNPFGLFMVKEGDVWVGIDNTDGDAWTEDFQSKKDCENWLLGLEEE